MYIRATVPSNRGTTLLYIDTRNTQQQFSNLSVPPKSTSIHVPSSTTQSVTFWELPAFLSQSTIGGRQGSNACTVISLLLAKTYLTNKSFLQLKNHQPLTPS